jgi:pimeloyl-ACP methyl ester carboxylesterase
MNDLLPAAYVPRCVGSSRFEPVRGLQYHLTTWGDAHTTGSSRPPLVLLHGWMDVGASFQFVVDALQAGRHVIAPDWRGFGQTAVPGADTYWFPDYVADLDALLDALVPDGVVDLAGHSMGGNVAMIYAGLRPQRIRRLINLEGFGLPDSRPEQAPKRYVQWLDELRAPTALQSYDNADGVARRLMRNNPLLSADKAAWLAQVWARPGADNRWHIQGDPAHKLANPVLYRKQEVLAVWRQITAPLLWVEGDQTDVGKWWGNRYPREDFEARLAVVPQVQRARLSPCGHMLHHDQPEALAAHIEAFLDA